MEKLDFAVTLSGTYWRKPPQYSIWIDDEKIVSDHIQDQQSQVVRFSQLISSGEHALKIQLENKTHDDVVIEDGHVVKDQLLNIQDITIEDISLGNLIWDSDYVLDCPQEFHGEIITHLPHCVNLGWNGTYILNFTSPFYIWLLEKL